VTKPQCFTHFGDNFDNPNCDICYLRLKCYEEWNVNDKARQVIEAEKTKPWSKQKPLRELFPETCSRCEGDSQSTKKTRGE